MSHDIVPAINGADRDETNSHHAADAADEPQPSSKRRRRRGPALSHDECLRMLGQLPGLVTLGLLSPAKANSIRAILQAILAATRETQPTAATPAAMEKLIYRLRQDPELFHLMEPLLSDDQLDSLVRGCGDDG